MSHEKISGLHSPECRKVSKAPSGAATEYIHTYVRLENPPIHHVPHGDPEDCPFSKVVSYVLVRGAPGSLISSLVDVLCRPGEEEEVFHRSGILDRNRNDSLLKF